MLRDAELTFPNLDGNESTDEKLTIIQNYLFQLLEALRYTLRNLSMKDNFNQQELGAWVGDTIKAETVISNTVITNEMYADYGAVADMVVDELRTDYMRARRYLEGDTSDLDYIHIHDEEISFLTAVVLEADGAPLTEQLHHGARYFWWRDRSRTEMTSLEDTGLPVTVYQYTEYNKGLLSFSRESGQTIVMLRLGAGTDASGTNGTLRIKKETTGARIWYTSSSGQVAELELLEDSAQNSVAHLYAGRVVVEASRTAPEIMMPSGGRWEFKDGTIEYYDDVGVLVGALTIGGES